MVRSVEPPLVVGAQRGRGRHAPALRELADGGDAHRAFQVDVELGLRKGDQISHRPMVASGAWERGAAPRDAGPSRYSGWRC